MKWSSIGIGLALAALPLTPSSAWAQAGSDYRYEFPSVMMETPMGVNIQTGKFRYQPFNLSVGPFVLQRGVNQADFPFLGGLYVAGLPTAGGGSQTTAFVSLGEADLQFYPNSTSGGATSFLSWNSTAQGWKLAWNGSVYTLTDKTGATYTLTPIPGYNGGAYALPKARPTSVVYADGHRIDISYDANAEPILLQSNRGYAIRYERTGGGSQVKICGFNLTATYVTTSTPCTGALQTITATYTVVSPDYKRLQSFVDIEGRTTTVNWTSSSFLECVTFPDTSTCEFTNVYGPQPGEIPQETKPDQVRIQTQPDGQQWTYHYQFPIKGDDDPPFFPGDPRTHYSYAWGSGPSFGFNVTFERGLARNVQMTSQTVNLEYSGTAINKITYPEGNSISILRDTIGNALTITEKPKPGSSEPDRVTQQSFPYAPAYASPYICDAASITLCTKPIWQKDPFNNQTDFTYDPAHGGTLTETGPAVNGVRPQKRYTYVQRNAMAKDSGGNFVAMQPPVWLLASESYCKTGAASGSGCAIAGDEVVKTYEYGPTTGANNLLLRGTVDDANGSTPIRTCYGYDTVGNRISETSPAPVGTSCP
ncbi:hypothetical protein L7H23_08720 [Sphingopyxis sp. BSN-002]|uniref:hypothetical protein n=1 Tax=Sphingopyxis sp. BSN-002 TaxID=2911495 RepID=UPI001EDA08A6|nr:hypothetical protein [Sphingopyxis sp. BSN-002]UKK86162.1 hypothetical protein L7H23_08720 [Sphingopyxis sp. BSN-002]